MKNLIDIFLSKLGLVRKVQHEQILKSNHDFMLLLGKAAKEKGVHVVLNEEYLDHCVVDTDLFVIGNRNVFNGVQLVGDALLHFAPQASINSINSVAVNNSVRGEKNESIRNP